MIKYKKALGLVCFFLISISLLAQKKDFSVGILYDFNSEENTKMLSRLTEETEAVVGEDAHVIISPDNVLYNNYDLAIAGQNYQTLVSNNVDMIIAVGTKNCLYVNSLETVPVPTAVSGGVLNELSANTGVQTSSKKNLIYLVVQRSYADDLKVLHELCGCQSIGVVVNAEENSLQFSQDIDKITDSLNMTWTRIPHSALDSIPVSFDYDVDGVYFTGNYVLQDAVVEALSDSLLNRKIPSMVAGGKSYVEKGMLATLHGEDHSERYIRRLALITESIVNGEEPSEINGFMSFTPSFTMNYHTMSALGIQPTYAQLYKANFVDDTLQVKSETVYSLPLIMQEALDENLGLQSAEKSVKISQKEVSIAKSSYLPEVTASANLVALDPDKAETGLGLTPQYTGNANVRLYQILYSGDASAMAGIQKNLNKAQEEYYNSEALNTVYEAVSSYFAALIVKTNLQIVRLNLNLTETNLDIANENYDAGQSGRSDVLRFKSKKAEDTKTVVNAMGQLKQAYSAINVMLNNPVTDRIDVDEKDLTDDERYENRFDWMKKIIADDRHQEELVGFLTEKAVENAPELKALQYNIKAVDRSVKQYGISRYLPTLALQAGYDYDFLSEGKGSTSPFSAIIDTKDPVKGYYSAGVSVSIPLISHNQKSLEKKKAIIQREQLELNRDEAQASIEKSISDVVVDISTHLSNIELSNISEKAAKESYELTLEAYSNGAVPIVQLLDAQNYYIQAKLSGVNAKYQFLLSMFTLERYLGRFMFLSTEEENEQFIQEYENYMLTH